MKKAISIVITLSVIISLMSLCVVRAEDSVVVGGVKYVLHDDAEPYYASAGSPDTPPSGAITILSSIKIGSKEYPVKYVESGAFGYNENITEVTVQPGVEAIYSYAFNDCTALEKVTLGEGLEKIYYCAFYRCGALKTVNIPSTVTAIGSEAFTATAITSVTIPASVEEIGYLAFWACEDLASITVASGNIKYKSVNGILFTAGGTILISYPPNKTGTSYTVPSDVIEIAASAFAYNTHLQRITLPSALSYIGTSAFEKCTALKNITIPASVTHCGANMFSECTSLTAINVASGNEAFYSAGGVLFTYDRKTLLEYPAGKTDAKYTVPSGTETISYEAFYENHYIEQVVLPSGLEYIGTWAFEGCSNLKTPVLPDGVKGIGGGAFDGTSVVYEEYNGVYYLGTASNKHYACVNWSDYLTEYVLHSDTKLVCGDAFCFHSDVEKIVLPEGLKYIGTYAFEYAYELTDISIPSTVEIIGAYAFYYTGKSEFTIPGGVKEIENSAFERNDQLTDLVIEEGVKIIGTSAFMYCFGLKTVTIPASVTEIRDYAFGYDDAIETVYYGGSEAQWNKLTKDLNWSNEALLNAKVIFGAVTEPGDCNGDGAVNNKDVVLLFKYVSEQEVTVVESACDFNGDGFVNNKDISALFKKVSAET